MNDINNIYSKVEETMKSLDGIRPATPGAFFFTRVQARLNKTERSLSEMISAFISRPAIAFAVILTVIFMNTLAVMQEKAAPSLVDQSETYVYEEFGVAVNSFYDYEISEP
ncbi:MAG: hypothetical protein WKF89_02670 [Chitinophagaceae bacterium]